MQLQLTSDKKNKTLLRYKLTEDKKIILKSGLKQPIESKTLTKTDINY